MWSRALLLSAMLFGCGLGMARADIIASNPTFLPNGAAFSGMGAGCFPLGGLCAGPGTLRIISSASTFSSSPPDIGQDITANVSFTAPVTTLLGMPVATFFATGTIDIGLSGRTAPDQTGSWATEIDSLELTGTLKGLAGSIGLDTSESSGGTTSITPISNGQKFRIDSFFDVFVDLQLGTLTATRGPLPETLVPAPEPATLALLCLPLAALGLVRRRRWPTAPPTSSAGRRREQKKTRGTHRAM